MNQRSTGSPAAKESAGGGASELTGRILAPRLVLLHGEVLADPTAVGFLPAAISSLRSALPSCLVVLLYRELSTERCCTLFRAGLFDALCVPIEQDRWSDLLHRVAECGHRLQGGRALQAESETTARRLHAHRRQLQSELSMMGAELIRAQQSLEITNRELADHMSQLSLLYQFGRELSTTRNWDATLENILQNLTEYVGADGAALVLRSAPGGPYCPRRTFRWEETSWDKVLLKLEDQLARRVATGILTPGIFHLEMSPAERQEPRIYALPLEHQDLRLGYLLLLDRKQPEAGIRPQNFVPFMQAIQVFLAEEVATAQMLDRLREIGSFNARVLESVRSFIWVIDDLGRTIYANRAARELLTGASEPVDPSRHLGFGIGRGRNTERGDSPQAARLFFELLQNDDLPELFLDGLLRLDSIAGSLLPQLLARGGSPFTGNGRIMRTGGDAVPVLVQTSTMEGRASGEKWLVVVAEDLRLAKKLEAEHQRAESLAQLVEMSATLAHEIRNPLMGLSAQAELLAEQLAGDDKRVRYLDVIKAEVERINDTISRLLNFVRPYEPQLGEVSLLELVRDCLDLVIPKAAARGISLNFSHDTSAGSPEAWQHWLDGAQIKQVLLNLLLNGVDAAPDDTQVEVHLGLSPHLEISDLRRGTTQTVPGIVLEISDAGPGVPEDDRERIFRPFYTTKSSGTGLGLSICWKIVTAHGGEIRVERRDERTIFSVLLPQQMMVKGNELEQESST